MCIFKHTRYNIHWGLPKAVQDIHISTGHITYKSAQIKPNWQIINGIW